MQRGIWVEQLSDEKKKVMRNGATSGSGPIAFPLMSHTHTRRCNIDVIVHDPRTIPPLHAQLHRCDSATTLPDASLPWQKRRLHPRRVHVFPSN